MMMAQRPACYHQFLVSPLVGGAGLVGLQIARTLHGQGHASRVWVPGRGPMFDAAAAAGVTVENYDAKAAYSPGRVRPLLANGRIGRRLRGFGPGVAHVHSPYYYRALRLGLRLARVRTVAHVQIEEHPDGLRWAFQDPPDLIVTCARFLVDHVRRALPDRLRECQPVVAVPNVVDTDRFRPGDRGEAKRRVGARGDVPLVLMLANLAPHKGQETAIRYAAMLKARGVHVTCWLAGSERDEGGHYTSRLQALVEELGVGDRVRLLGQRSDAPDLLRAADLFLLPSTHEGLPLSILEAQATRVPVLANATAGVPEVVRDGETGFLIPQADADGYARRIETLLADPDLYERVAGQAHAQATREYNWESYFARMTELYQELTDQGPLRRTGWRRLVGA